VFVMAFKEIIRLFRPLLLLCVLYFNSLKNVRSFINHQKTMNLHSLFLNVVLLLGVLNISGCQSLSLFSSPIQKRGVSGFFKDTVLHAKIIKALSGKYSGSITLLIQKGRVMLVGYVKTENDRQNVLTTLGTFPDIHRLADHLLVGAGSDSVMNDTYLSQSLQSHLFFDTRISSQNYHITASHKILYILGTARSEAEKNNVLGHAESMSVRRVISDIAIDATFDTESAQSHQSIE
jgi:osmotically-inducible protein OsmY